MPRPNDWNAPVCPICTHDLAHNGKTKSGKVRWRCCYCKGFNETANATSLNANVRTAYGFTKRKCVYNNVLIKLNTTEPTPQPTLIGYLSQSPQTPL